MEERKRITDAELRTLKAAAFILSLLSLTGIFRRSGANRLGAAGVLSTAFLRVFERSGLAINTRREDTVVHVAPRGRARSRWSRDASNNEEHHP